MAVYRNIVANFSFLQDCIKAFFLSDAVKNTINILSWSHQFNIICGLAEGVAYLHGGSGVKIIHRDIKSSNILLDENLNPKIADFGLDCCVVLLQINPMLALQLLEHCKILISYCQVVAIGTYLASLFSTSNVSFFSNKYPTVIM